MSRLVNARARIALAVALTAVAARDAAAQWNVARFETEPNRVYTTFGLDPALVGAVGYGRVVRVQGDDFQLAGDVGVVTARLDAHDFRARLGTQTALARWRSVRLAGSASLRHPRHRQRDLPRAELRRRPRGDARRVSPPVVRGGGAREGQGDRHARDAQRLVPDERLPRREGRLVPGCGGTVRYGLTGGVALGRTELSGRVGRHRTEGHDALLAPLYATVGVGVGF